MERIGFHDLPDEIRENLEMINLPGQDERECINLLRTIAQTFPGFVPARLNLAAMLLESGDIANAESTYRSVLEDDPEEIGAIGGLATVYSAKQEFQLAEGHAYLAIKAGYEWPPLYEVIAQVREHEGDRQASAEAYLRGYRQAPHSWNYLEQYCRLMERSFHSPMDIVPQTLSDERLKSLFDYIDTTAHTPDVDGQVPGCDHTFRFTEEWAEQNAVDIIDLYQFLNSHGGFCDCEVCFNVESSVFESEYNEDSNDEEIE